MVFQFLLIWYIMIVIEPWMMDETHDTEDLNNASSAQRQLLHIIRSAP